LKLNIVQNRIVGWPPSPGKERAGSLISTGRTWESNGERHFLLMVQGDRVFELAYSGSTGRWRLVRRPEDFGPHQTAT